MILAVGAVELFYEKQGKGRPLILLHGNGEDHHIFDESVDALAKEWTVYRPDSRGHGQSSPVREFHYQDMAEDIISMIEELQLVRPCLYGFSDGGITGLLIAAQRPVSYTHLDALFFQNGAKLTFGSPDKVKVFYATH